MYDDWNQAKGTGAIGSKYVKPSRPQITTQEILSARSAKNKVDERTPYAFFVEEERTAGGLHQDVATIFLTNRECPYHCLFCDLWRNTTDSTVPIGAIPAQIDYALARLPRAQHVKLYNSGNFFDGRAIPPEDYPEVAARVCTFETVIVENHPKLCGNSCVEFGGLLKAAAIANSQRAVPQLEVAMGLETVHPEILPRLNKQMTVKDFRDASDFLRGNDIALRAFILLQPPFMPPQESVAWALRSLEFALECGVRVITIIPTRGGNGIMEMLGQQGLFVPPPLEVIEEFLEQALPLTTERVFVDLWDIARIAADEPAADTRVERLRQMNRLQHVLPSCW